MLLAAAFLTLAQPSSQPPAHPPLTYVTYVGQMQDRCEYQTGDVFMNAAQFEHDLRERFDRAANLIVFHPSNIAPACLEAALTIARRVGFRSVRAEIAPANLDMGPPR